MDTDLRRLIVYSCGFIIALLLSINGYFISRLVSNIDKQQEMIWTLRQDFLMLKFSVESLEKRFSRRS